MEISIAASACFVRPICCSRPTSPGIWADIARSNPQAIGPLGWIFFGLQLAGIVLSWKYFVPPPVIFSAVLAILTGWAAWLVKRR